jgi:periplasmic divalent cation tolerance protein
VIEVARGRHECDEVLMTTPCVVVSTTVASDEDAREIALKVLGARLVACVQMLAISSLYTWKGVIADEKEVLLLLKTRAELYPALEREILSVHKYETPEIVMHPISGGLAGYLAWIDDVTKDGGDI